MNKLFTKIATAMVGIAMAVGVGVAVGNNNIIDKVAAAGTEEVDLSVTIPDYVSDNSCTISAGQNVKNYKTLYLDENITLSTNGTATNEGSFWNVNDSATWRLYNGGANTSGQLVFTADNDCTIKQFSITWATQGNNGVLGTSRGNTNITQITSGQLYSSSQSVYVANSNNTKTNGQVRITAVRVIYDKPTGGATYSTQSLAISGTIVGSYNTNTDEFNNSGFTVTKTLVNDEDPEDTKNEEVTSGITFHWEYVSTGEEVTLPIDDSDTYSVRIWASVLGETLTTKDNASSGSRYVNGDLTIAYAPSQIEITYSSYSANVPASGYATMDWSANGISGKVYSIKNNSSYIQFQANTSYVYNSLAISGYITSIQIAKASGDYSNLTVFVADSENGAITEMPGSGGFDNNSDWTWNFDSDDHYCYFRIDATSSYAKYLSNITIEYQKVTTVDPTGITLNNNNPINMDTYGFGRRRLSATVEPFNNNDPTVNWGTSNSSVVTIEDGVLTAVGVGNATVYATTGNYVSDQATPDLKASVSVTVTQALYKKATFVPTSTSAATQADDYLDSGSVTVTSSSTGTWNNDKSAIQLSAGKDSAFTISGYAGMKITGIDLIMSSNGSAGTGALTVTAGTTDILEIESAPFSDASWNGAYDANACDLYKATANYVVSGSETIKFTFSCSVNSIYIHSVAIRYLDYSLEQWCENFLSQITCDGGNPGSITDDSNWGTLSTSFAALDSDLREIAAEATADKNSENVIEQAMARYDLILRKYGIGTGDGQHTDFIGRFGLGTINGPLGTQSTLLGNDSSTSTSIIIVIISVASVAAIGGYFFLRRRKED